MKVNSSSAAPAVPMSPPVSRDVQLRRARAAVGRPQHAAASLRQPRGRRSVAVKVAPDPSAPPAGRLHAQRLPHPALPASAR